MTDQQKEQEPNLISIYRKRASAFRRNASITIAAISLLLIAGILTFIYAGDITRREDLSAETVAYLDRAAKTTLENQTHITSALLLADVKEGKLTEKATENLKDAANSLHLTATLLKGLEERPITYQGQMLNIISIATTRIGIVILLLFLVQILVPLFRYYARLAAFFDSRADVLVLAGSNYDDLEKLINALSTENIDFGKLPVPPTQSAYELAKEVISSQKSK